MGKRGTRPRQPAGQRYANAFLFGAICPALGKGADLALPHADTEVMQPHLQETSRHAATGSHGVILLGRAGWLATGKLVPPPNVTLAFLPSRALELNPQEDIWQYMRANWLSNRILKTYEDIVAKPDTISSAGMRDRANAGRSQ